MQTRAIFLTVTIEMLFLTGVNTKVGEKLDKMKKIGFQTFVKVRDLL